MIYPDVNLLLYAYDTESQFHPSSSKWLEDALMNQQVYFSWHTITGFLRIITNSKASASPLRLDQAIGIVNDWLELENTHLVSMEKKNWPLFAKLLTESQATGNLVMDAHVAAMAASCGATVASTDRDFTRFPGLQFTNPIARA